MPITTTERMIFTQTEMQQRGAGRIECTRWLMERFLLIDRVNTLVKAGPYDVPFTMYAILFWFCPPILNDQSAFQQFQSAASHWCYLTRVNLLNWRRTSTSLSRSATLCHSKQWPSVRSSTGHTSRVTRIVKALKCLHAKKKTSKESSRIYNER